MHRRNKCFVKNCDSGYKTCKEKVFLFSTPKDAEMFHIWTRMVPQDERKFTTADVLCEKHFLDEDVVRGWKSGNISYKYKLPRLSKSAIPTIFPSPTTNETSKVGPVLRSSKTKTNKDAADNKIVHVRLTDESMITRVNIADIVALNNEQCDVFPLIAEQNLFDSVLNKKVEVKLPNKKWAIHCINEEYICIVEVDVLNGKPVTLRQIVINKDFCLRFFVRDKEIFNTHDFFDICICLNSASDLENIINKFENYKLKL